MSLETAAAERPTTAAQGKGSFIWYELMTRDVEAAKAFYTDVVGWTASEMPSPDGPYTVLSAAGRGVGGMFAMGEGPTGWIGYIGVPDVDAATARVAGEGGAVHKPPRDIPEVGRFSIVADPGGAMFALMTPAPREAPPPFAPGALGSIGWHELYATQGGEAALAFYGRQFGWTPDGEMDMGTMGQYRFFADGGPMIGAVMDKPPQMPAAAWAFYFVVDALDAAIDRLTARGGTVTMGPHEVPGGSWIVQGIDPQGVNFALVAPKR